MPEIGRKKCEGSSIEGTLAMSYIPQSSNFFQVPKDVLDSVVSLLENVSFVVKNAKEFQVKRVRLKFSRSYKNN